MIFASLFSSVSLTAEPALETKIEAKIAKPLIAVKQPDFSVDFEFVKAKECCVAVVKITNNSKKDITLEHPGNRFALAFVLMNEHGNVIAPTGFAKVSDVKHEPITLKPGEVFKHNVEGMYGDKYLFRFLSATALFGYELKFGETYRVIAVYRPKGAEGEGICSVEKIVKFEEHVHEIKME